MASASTTKKINYEFTTDDDELNDEGTTDRETMCDFYKLNLPASASILSRQIAKSQAKRAKKEDTRRRRIDLSTVREQDETKLSISDDQSLSSPQPPKNDEENEPTSPISTTFGGRSRIDSAPMEVKLKRQISLPEDERITEPMDEEEAQLLAMLLSGIANGPEDNGIESFLRETERKFSLPVNLSQVGTNTNQPSIPSRILPSPIMPSAKVHEWLERSNSPDDVSVCTSAILEDSGLALQNEDDEDEFFDAEDAVDGKNRINEENKDVVMVLEHDMQGLSLNRNMAAMTQSLVRVEEETMADGANHDFSNGRAARSTSVSPRPSNDQFVRNSPGSATFNVKHSSIEDVHSHSNGVPKVAHQPSPPQPNVPPTVTINPSTPSRPASVASSTGKSSNMAMKTSNIEGLQDLIHMQEEALRRAALDSQSDQLERKLSWNSDNEAIRQSTSMHSSIGSLSSSKSVDGQNSGRGATPVSKIPAPRSRLPTPRGSTLPKRVHSVAAAVRFTTSKPQHAVGGDSVANGADVDECF